MSSTIQLSIGNTYRRLPDHEADMDCSGTRRKVHDWTLFVDILIPANGNAEKLERVIQRVSFDVGSSFLGNPYVCYAPVPAKQGNSQQVWRFCIRKTSFDSVFATIKVRGAGGSVETYSHSISFSSSKTAAQHTFKEKRRPLPLRMLPMPEEKFGVELECTTNVALSEIAAVLPVPCILVSNYSEGRRQVGSWKIVPDSSIQCSRSMPNCNTFELVSPVLCGGEGLHKIATITRALKDDPNSTIKINKSMGFHVHVNVENYTHGQLIKICQQFIKYEDVFDSFMPPSRRTGSVESKRYFQSNRDSVGKFLTNKGRNLALAECRDIESLALLMNAGNSRYYKLNLQNLREGRQPTLEFRQHSATINYDKIAAWVRFCTVFCREAARPTALGASAAPNIKENLFKALFFYVIKDRALRDFYAKRRNELRLEREDEHCCSGCAHGGSCQGAGSNKRAGGRRRRRR